MSRIRRVPYNNQAQLANRRGGGALEARGHGSVLISGLAISSDWDRVRIRPINSKGAVSDVAMLPIPDDPDVLQHLADTFSQISWERRLEAQLCASNDPAARADGLRRRGHLTGSLLSALEHFGFRFPPRDVREEHRIEAWGQITTAAGVRGLVRIDGRYPAMSTRKNDEMTDWEMDPQEVGGPFEITFRPDDEAEPTFREQVPTALAVLDLITTESHRLTADPELDSGPSEPGM